jgi:hypothetical protein
VNEKARLIQNEVAITRLRGEAHDFLVAVSFDPASRGVVSEETPTSLDRSFVVDMMSIIEREDRPDKGRKTVDQSNVIIPRSNPMQHSSVNVGPVQGYHRESTCTSILVFESWRVNPASEEKHGD